LADFIVVMREFEIEPTTVNIDSLFSLEGFLNHGRTLDMPPWSSFSEWRVPAWFSFFHSLPKSKIFMEFLDFDLVDVLILHLAVRGKRFKSWIGLKYKASLLILF
jgi:hypothetical protein